METTRQKMYEIRNQRAGLVAEAGALLQAGDLDAWSEKQETIKGLNRQLDAMESQLAAEEQYGPARASGMPSTPQVGAFGSQSETDAVKAFASAARNGFRVTKGAGDMMQEGVDADGGYTVPQDIVTRIYRYAEANESLLDEVTVVPVKTSKGRRTLQKRAKHKGFATAAEATKIGKLDGPSFDVVNYNIEKRSGYLGVTNELLADSDNDIADTAVQWMGADRLATINTEVAAVIATNPSKDLKNLDGIIGAYIDLGSAFRNNSKLITNSAGLKWLSTLKDNNGRYLLSPNPADPHVPQLCVGINILPVKVYDVDTLPNSSGTKIPMIVGNLKDGIRYWDRQRLSIRVSTDATVGTLNAFEQDCTIWRGSIRDDCTAWDEDAFVNGYIDTAAPAAAG